MRSTAVDSLLQECGELPLKLRRKRAVLRYTAKLKISTGNPAATILEDTWHLHYATWKTGREPIQLQTKQFTSSIEIIQSEIMHEAPWKRYVKIDTTLTSVLRRMDEATTTLLNIQAHINQYSKNIQIYTDASVKETGRAGAAFCIPEEQVEVEIRISDKTSIITGELIAIYTALQFLQTTDITKKEIVILTDSLTAIRLIADTKYSQNNIETEILQLMETLENQQKLDISIIWVPGHAGITGNERADRVAKTASEKSVVDIKTDNTIQELYSNIDIAIYAEWQKNYTSSATAQTYKKLEPVVNKNIKYMENNRRKETIITRLRLGRCLLNQSYQGLETGSRETTHR